MFLKARLLFQKSRFPCAICKKYQKKLHFFQFFLVFYQFFRYFCYITATEASLKLKEISYINSVAIASGELKHGTLALIDKDAVVIAICTQGKIKTKLLSNLEEIKARGGKVIVVSQFDDFKDFPCVKLPKYDELLMPIVSIIPLQFLALRICELFGYNPDKPRNLAKSVTVE